MNQKEYEEWAKGFSGTLSWAMSAYATQEGLNTPEMAEAYAVLDETPKDEADKFYSEINAKALRIYRDHLDEGMEDMKIIKHVAEYLMKSIKEKAAELKGKQQ